MRAHQAVSEHIVCHEGEGVGLASCNMTHAIAVGLHANCDLSGTPFQRTQSAVSTVVAACLLAVAAFAALQQRQACA